MHERTWDWYAVEKYNDHYKVIARNRTDQPLDYLVLKDQIFDDPIISTNLKYLKEVSARQGLSNVI